MTRPKIGSIRRRRLWPSPWVERAGRSTVRRRWVAIARGDEPPDLVLSGGEVLSVFTGETFLANVAIADGHIVGVGDYDGPTTHDVSGALLIPGLIDGHCHIESSKLNVDE